jgi:hypothetical protein
MNMFEDGWMFFFSFPAPRLVKEELRGVAHRLVAAHHSLLEVYPGMHASFDLTCALRIASFLII